MDHNMISNLLQPGARQMTLLKKDNNLDQLDNLNEIPAMPAVYAICGRVNNAPANPRMVGAAMNLQQAVTAHFSEAETDDCLGAFMRSIKIKELVYEILPDATPELLAQKKEAWTAKLNPACNEELNKVY